MTILKAFKYRIYPTAKQEVLLNKTFGCVRVVWNHNIETFNKFDKNQSGQWQPLTSTQLKQKFEWMGEVSNVANALPRCWLNVKFYRNQKQAGSSVWTWASKHF
jgi:putative transposase